MAARRAYLAALLRMIARAEAATLAEVKGVTLEDGARADDLGDLVAALKRAGVKIRVVGRAFDAGRVSRDVASTTRRESAADVKRMIGVSVNDLGLDPQINAFVRENTKLIRSLAEDQAREITALVRDHVSEGTRIETVRGLIEQRFEVARTRAALIARTETAKLKGQIDRTRMTRVGLTHYRWRTTRDERVRDAHADLEGQRFAFDDPPVAEENGEAHHPGEFPNCRCYAEPDTSAVFGPT